MLLGFFASRPCSTRRAFVTLLFSAAFPAWAAASPADTLADRVQEIEAILHREAASSIASDRLMCATGIRGEMLDSLNSAFGEVGLPNHLADVCLAYLTRSARDGRGIVAVRENRAPGALALDQAFMSAFAKRDPVPANLPAVSMSKAIADRCFAAKGQVSLCSAAGYALGVRVANGETIPPG